MHAFERAAKAVALRNTRLKYANELQQVGDTEDAAKLVSKVSSFYKFAIVYVCVCVCTRVCLSLSLSLSLFL